MSYHKSYELCGPVLVFPIWAGENHNFRHFISIKNSYAYFNWLKTEIAIKGLREKCYTEALKYYELGINVLYILVYNCVELCLVCTSLTMLNYSALKAETNTWFGVVTQLLLNNKNLTNCISTSTVYWEHYIILNNACN